MSKYVSVHLRHGTFNQPMSYVFVLVGECERVVSGTE